MNVIKGKVFIFQKQDRLKINKVIKKYLFNNCILNDKEDELRAQLPLNRLVH